MQLTDVEQLLLRKTEQALTEGRELEQWYRTGESSLQFFPLTLKGNYKLPNRATGFFSTVSIGGTPRDVMGCRQDVELGKLTSPQGPVLLKEFVLGHFQRLGNWKYPDGTLGGFTFEKTLHKTVAGEVGKFADAEQQGPVDLRELGSKYAWLLLTVHIHDFVMKMGPIEKRIPEAAYVAPNPQFIHVVENPSPELVQEVSIGYPFVDVAPHKNIFGFGPGKFGAAVKLFSFFLTRAGDVRVRMVFIAAPRSQKVFDFGVGVPDPIYGFASLMKYLTLGLFNPQMVHDRMDKQMLSLHCEVHQTLMDGMASVWTNWLQQNA
jgi:hypothetical protein